MARFFLPPFLPTGPGRLGDHEACQDTPAAAVLAKLLLDQFD